LVVKSVMTPLTDCVMLVNVLVRTSPSSTDDTVLPGVYRLGLPE
jgi:hypothetical protein